MIEITVLLDKKEVHIKRFDGTKVMTFFGRNPNSDYWDVIAEWCEHADKCGIVPKITIVKEVTANEA